MSVLSFAHHLRPLFLAYHPIYIFIDRIDNARKMPLTIAQMGSRSQMDRWLCMYIVAYIYQLLLLMQSAAHAVHGCMVQLQQMQMQQNATTTLLGEEPPCDIAEESIIAMALLAPILFVGGTHLSCLLLVYKLPEGRFVCTCVAAACVRWLGSSY